MAVKFNPFTGQLQIDEKGSGGGVFEGEVATFADLPETSGNPPVGSAYLVRESTGVWLVNRRQAGVYIRSNNTGVRADDWTYGGDYPVTSVNGQTGAVDLDAADISAAYASHDHQPSDIYSDAAKVTATTLSAGEPNGVYLRNGSDNGKATYKSGTGYSIWWDSDEGEWVLGNVPQSHKYFIGSQDTTYPWQVSTAWTLGAQGSGTVPAVGQATLTDYQLNAAQDSVSTRVPKSGNATSTEVVLGSDTRLANSRTPTSHAASHNYGGSDAVTRVEQARTLMDTSPDNEDNVALYYTSEVGAPQKWVVDSPADFRTALELGTAATAATGDFAAASHSHELTALAATGATNGHVLTANGSNGVTFAALPASGVTGAAASASDVLGVSGANITGVDANADRIVFWDDSASALKYLEAGSGLSISGTTLTATATGTIGGSTSTDNAIVRADSTSNTVQDSAFIIADNATASPNNTVNHASIQATGGTTNVSVSIVPKGTGAFMLRVPDAASTGGNARGANAVDLQTSRSAAAQVASGQESVVCGGVNNTASATQSVVCGGSGNTASGFQSAVLGGRSNSASNDRCVAFGDGNAASSTNAVAFGVGNLASSAQALAIGSSSRADRHSFLAHAAGSFASVGDAQRIRAVLRCKTTTNAAVEMALDGSATYFTIPSGKVIFCNIKVVGVKSDGSAVATYERQYAAKNIAATSSQVYAAVTIGTDNAAGTSLEVATVDAGDYIRIRPTGIASETWRWVASVDAVEVAYGT